MYKPPGIPPIQNIADKPTRDALLALSDGWNERNGNGKNRFISKEEFDLALKKMATPATDNKPQETSQRGGGGTASATSLMVRVPNYPVVDPFSGVAVIGKSFSLQSCYENLLWMDSDLAASINDIRRRLDALENP